jgi:CBS domain containing-hemolysin-like protein
MDLLALQLLLLLVLVLCSAFFSGAETALFSLGRGRLLQYAEDNRPDRQRVAALMRTYGRTLITLVAGNMFVNTGLSVVSTDLVGALRLSPNQTTLVSIAMTLVVLLMFGEIAPKAMTLQVAEPFSLRFSGLIKGLRILMTPVIWLVEQVSSRVLDLLGRRHSPPLRPEEYGEYVDLAHAIGAFSVAETDLLRQVFLLRQRRVNRVMTPRIDVCCVRRDLSASTVADLIRTTRQPFYPVVTEGIDDTVAILSVRDFFSLSAAERESWAASGAVFPSIVIPENTSLTRALEALQAHAAPVGLVADEYGGIVGLLSQKWIFEEIVGDIDDEYDTPPWQIRRLGPGVWRVDGQMPLEALPELLPTMPPLPSEAHTLNGLFALILGRIPEVGDRICLPGIELEAIAVDRQRVSEAELRARPVPPPREEAS